MLRLLNLPSGCTVLADDLSRARRPYYHGQLLVAIRLENGILIEAKWDDHGQRCTVLASEGQGESKAIVGNRSITNPNWVPGIIGNMAALLNAGDRENAVIWAP